MKRPHLRQHLPHQLPRHLSLPTLHHFRRNLELYRSGIDASFGMIIYRWSAGQPLFLVIKHNQGHWDFPKGHAEGSEEPLEAANREVAEEVGLSNVKPNPDTTFQEKYIFRVWGKKISKVVTFWLAETSETDIQVQQAEIEAYKWVSLAEGLELITFEAGRTLLTQVSQHLQSK